jgi:DNA-binding response OmpR family regulator
VESSTADRIDGEGGTIVVYDDDTALLAVVVAMLRRDGHEVTATRSERDARRLARSGRFDLVILDIGCRQPNTP